MDLAAALAKAFKRAANAMPAVATTEDAATLLGGGPWWSTMRDMVAEVLTAKLMDGAGIGINEARHDPIFKASKLQKALDEDPAGEIGTGPDLAEVPTAAVGVNWDLVNTDAEAWARRYSLQLVNDIEATTKSRMRRALTNFITSGKDDIDDLTRTFTRLIDDPKRAQLIAQTESTRSFAQGNTLAWRAQGIAGRRWFNVEDSRVCPVCGALGGKVAALGKPFVSEFGEVDNPPAHPGCRCYVQPVETIAAPKPKPAPIALAPAPTVDPTPVAMAPAAVVPGATQPGDGPKVGRALKVRNSPISQKINDAVALIDSVHSDGELVKLAISSRSLGGTTKGEYTYNDNGPGGVSVPVGIAIGLNVSNPTVEMTTAHEIGHFLDNMALYDGKRSGFGSESAAAMAPWRNAVYESKAFKQLSAQLHQPTVERTLADGSTITMPTNKNHVKYLLSDVELFARSYAQYIAVKTQDPNMMSQLDYMRNNLGNPHRMSQWNDDDFTPVVAAFDEIFKAKGWLK